MLMGISVLGTRWRRNPGLPRDVARNVSFRPGPVDRGLAPRSRVDRSGWLAADRDGIIGRIL